MVYIESPHGFEFDPPFPMSMSNATSPLTIVELGSGTGVVGIALAEKLARLERTQDHIILTDLPEVCPLLEANLPQRPPYLKSALFARPLAWG